MREALCYLSASTANASTVVYQECRLAEAVGEPLRLVPKLERGLLDMPAYSMPRVLRYAALGQSEYIELDMPASHCIQALKFAKAEGLPHEMLREAFLGPRRAQSGPPSRPSEETP